MKSCHLVYAFCFLLFFPAKGQSSEPELDSLTSLLNSTEEYNARIASLLAISEYHRAREFKNSLPYLREALEISQIRKDRQQEAVVLRYLTQNYRLQGLQAKAIEYALISEHVFDSLGVREELLLINSELGILYQNTNNFEKSLDVHLASVELVKTNLPSGAKARHYFNAGYAYTTLGMFEKAEEYYRTAIDICRESSFVSGEMVMLASLGHLNMEMGNYEEAKNNLKRPLPFFEQNNQLSSIAGCYYNLGLVSSSENDHVEAIRLHRKALAIYEKLGSLHFIQETNKQLYFAYSITRNYDEAKQALKNHKVIKDSIDSKEKRALAAELQTKYETEKKEAEIVSLSQQASIQSLEIKQKNQAIVIGLFGFAFVLAVSYLVYKQRISKREQTQTELEQRFLRSQLNPHFISNALVAVQSFMLNNDTEAAATYLAKFSKLMREILENSRKEFIPVEEEINMLSNYLDIHKLRFKDSFQYSISIDENINPEEDTIPPMFVQPFVENSIEHGIINAQGKGTIDLNFVKQDGYISIAVKDNGGGLVLSQHKSESHNSLSTAIIKERMELFNQSLKNKIQLVLGEIKNEKGEIAGTKVELKVPFSYI